MNNLSILLIEDEKGVADMLVQSLNALYVNNVIVVNMLTKAVKILKTNTFDAIICDLNLPDSKGKDTVIAVQALASNTPIIAITGNDGSCDYSQAIHLGAQDFLIKGEFNFNDLVSSVKKAIERHKVRQMFIPLNQDLSDSQRIANQLKQLTLKGTDV